MTSSNGNVFSVPLVAFVRGIHRWPVNSPHTGQWRGSLMFSFFCLNKRLSKQSRRRWIETPSCSLYYMCLLWRHCNAICCYYELVQFWGLLIEKYRISSNDSTYMNYAGRFFSSHESQPMPSSLLVLSCWALGLSFCTRPADTRRDNNVMITSKRRRNVVLT